METNGKGKTAPWMESPAGRQVQSKLADEHTLEAINHLLARIGTLEKAVEKLSDLMQQGPGMLAMMADIADETYRNADERGINIDERVRNTLALAEKLTAPETTEKLMALVKLGDQLPGMVAMTMDIVDESMHQATEQGFDLQVLGSVTTAAGTALAQARADHPAKPGGLFRTLRALKDPDRQKGLGFLLNFLKYFGKNLQK